MNHQDENRWADAVAIVTCPKCEASAEAPAPIEHKSGCLLRLKWEIESGIATERAGGWTAEPA